MTRPSERLRELGLRLPAVVPPLAAYRPAVRSGALVFTAGQLPLADGQLTVTGVVGPDAVSTSDGASAARTATLNALAAAAEEAGGLDRIIRVVRVVVYVAATAGFSEHPAVANGASELLGEVFGESGHHARSAIGVASLPLNAPVEVELVVEVAADDVDPSPGS